MWLVCACVWLTRGGGKGRGQTGSRELVWSELELELELELADVGGGCGASFPSSPRFALVFAWVGRAGSFPFPLMSGLGFEV